MATEWVLDPTDPTVAILGDVTLHNVHPVEVCAGNPCVIHNPSDHHMRSWPMHWRDDRGITERICSHGIGHPDPDQRGDGVHGCDRCC